MNIKHITADQIPGYNDEYAPKNRVREDVLAVVRLGEYESLSYPCTKDHKVDKATSVEHCPQKTSLMMSAAQHLRRDALDKYDRIWEYPPLWVRCYNKVVYVFRKPWGVNLGLMAHPRLYIEYRDEQFKHERDLRGFSRIKAEEEVE
jgi:hypothetical protein